jgi:hypothetical protein
VTQTISVGRIANVMGLEKYCLFLLKKRVTKNYKCTLGMAKRKIANDLDAAALCPKAMSAVSEVIDHVARANPVAGPRGANSYVTHESTNLASILGKEMRARILIADIFFDQNIAAMIDQAMLRASGDHTVPDDMWRHLDIGAGTNMKMKRVTPDSVGVGSVFEVAC